MKKKIVTVLLCTAIATALLGCGNKEDKAGTTEAGTESVAVPTTEEASGAVTEETVNSLSFDIDAASCVTSLADYSNVEVSLTGDYEVPQDYVDQALEGLLESVGLTEQEVTDRDTVQEGDIANIDYTGYFNDEAFEGGADTGFDLSIGSGTFVPGFEEGLIGAKVGETVTIDVTFPETYSNNPDLAGQLTQFVVTINSIKVPVTIDMLNDEQVAEYFADTYEITTVQELSDYATGYVEEQAVTSCIIEYMLTNSTVDVPEDYLNARVDEYVEQAAAYNGLDMASFMSMMEAYGSSLDEYKEEVKESIRESIAQELIFEAIGIQEGYASYGEEYDAFIQKNLDAGAYSTAEDLYDILGDGNPEYGEKYAKRMYVMNQALDFVKKNATVSGAKVYTYKEQ